MSGPNCSILTTVYNRDRRTLNNTLAQIRKNDLTNCELIIVDDGSTKDYGWAQDYLAQYEVPFKWVETDTKEAHPETYQIEGGYNNPVHAWNTALEVAESDIIVTLASDCLIPPNAISRARVPGKMIWMSGVIDIDTSTQYLGLKRIRPYGWFMSWNRSYYDIKWDLNYLKGMGYDDNDFTARLALASHQIGIDLSVTAFHQSHKQVAYSDGHLGRDTNERYTWKKWGGVPWSGCDTDPLHTQQARRDELYVLHVEQKVLA